MTLSTKRRAVVSAVLLLLVFVTISSNPFWRTMYPIRYQQTIQQAADDADVNPLLIASVIRTESKFHTQDVSHAGAIGLMQLMPDTAQWMANRLEAGQSPIGIGQSPALSPSGSPNAIAPQSTKRDLSEPTFNILLGTWYIRYLISQFHGNQVAAIAAYNAGPQRVKLWIQSGIWNGQLETITAIPVGETRHFVDRVFYNLTLYTKIYGQQPGWQASHKNDS